jgi:hypothetical protein
MIEIRTTPEIDDKFVVLREIKVGNIFWTSYKYGEDPTRTSDGNVSYEVISYTKTPQEAIGIWHEEFYNEYGFNFMGQR